MKSRQSKQKNILLKISKAVTVNSTLQVERYNELKWVVFSLLVGYFYAVYCVGFGFIHNVSDVRYLGGGDFAQHFLGWELYRYDEWRWPLTVTDRIQYPDLISIVYTDSFPLFSVLLKSISGILPKIFIYQGIEFVLNCSLQFYFACLIFRTLRKDIWLTIIGGLFCLMAPILLQRMSGIGFNSYHDSLTSQWLILANIYLILKPVSRRYYDFAFQLLLLFLALGTHAYIFAMIFVLSLAFLYRVAYVNKLSIYLLIIRLAAIVMVSVVSYYLFGYLVLNGSITSDLFGSSSMNLNAFFNANQAFFLPAFETVGTMQYEGYQYLGFGIILGIIFTIYSIWKNRHSVSLRCWINGEYVGLTLACFLLFLISLSTKVTFNSYVLFDYTRVFENTFFMTIFGALRSSGRLFWPVYYLLMVFIVIKCYDGFSVKIARALILTLLLIQVIDLKPMRDLGYENIQENITRAPWNADLVDPFWYNLSAYKHLVILMNPSQDLTGYSAYFKFGMVAALNNLTTNMFYLARGSNEGLYSQVELFQNGVLEDQSIYVVDERLIQQMDTQIISMIDCSRIDTYVVCKKKLDLKE